MFGKKTTAEELIKLFSALSDEEKQKFLGAVNGDGEAESTPDPAPDGEPNADADAGAESESEEQSAPSAEETEGAGESAPNPAEGAAPAEGEPFAPDNQAQDNFAEVLEGFGARLTAIEESMKGLTELQEQMQKFTQAQADKFGYNGTIPGNKKEYREMSADEMKTKILNGEI